MNGRVNMTSASAGLSCTNVRSNLAAATRSVRTLAERGARRAACAALEAGKVNLAYQAGAVAEQLIDGRYRCPRRLGHAARGETGHAICGEQPHRGPDDVVAEFGSALLGSRHGLVGISWRATKPSTAVDDGPVGCPVPAPRTLQSGPTGP